MYFKKIELPVHIQSSFPNTATAMRSLYDWVERHTALCDLLVQVAPQNEQNIIEKMKADIELSKSEGQALVEKSVDGLFRILEAQALQGSTGSQRTLIPLSGTNRFNNSSETHKVAPRGGELVAALRVKAQQTFQETNATLAPSRTYIKK